MGRTQNEYMRIAVISDIHGNLEAFTSVLEDIRKQQVDAIISLGDNIGYGADSELVIQNIIRHAIFSIIGNHELAVIDEHVRRWFKNEVEAAILHAITHLSEDSKAFIHKLKTSLVIQDCRFVHGFPPDSAIFYLFQASMSKFRKTFAQMEESICFVGHTHKLSLVCAEEKKISVHELPVGTTQLQKKNKYIVNAGSVGQPRNGDPNAKYLIWDYETYTLTVLSIVYDTSTAAEKIRIAGIPEKFAQRLYGRTS